MPTHGKRGRRCTKHQRSNPRSLQLLAIRVAIGELTHLRRSDNTYLKSSTSYRATVYQLLQLTRAQQPINGPLTTADRSIQRFPIIASPLRNFTPDPCHRSPK